MLFHFTIYILITRLVIISYIHFLTVFPIPLSNDHPSGIAAWFASYNCTDVCMESTGKYWIPAFNQRVSVLRISLSVILSTPSEIIRKHTAIIII